MRITQTLFTVLLVSLLIACSLPPDKPVTRKELAQSNIYRNYKIEESPEEVLNALNMEGEVVLRGEYMNRPVYIKVLATADGLEISSYDR
ncbi:hypothetical protein [Geopsychrobacter electrodiphilus]|uniref:hypothetical protein n=1 Tax=Geopsychrobacter electrodiphilus TaxID=225196 RepID=UPI000381EBCD|nr:hypothetical protein [Geopsychrobacter electrodiphilus]